ALGLQPTTTGPLDGFVLFTHFLIANGGDGIVTPGGKPQLDDPQGKEGGIKGVTHITTAHNKGHAPPGAPHRRGADHDNAFHARQIIMDLDGTISTELTLSHKKELYDDIVTMGLPLDNTGKKMPSPLGVIGCFIPTGAKNVEVAKDFLKYLIQPKVANEY